MNKRELKGEIEWLQRRVDEMYYAHVKLAGRHNRLMDYLGLEEETEPRIVKLRGAGTPAPSRYTDVTKDQNGGGTG